MYCPVTFTGLTSFPIASTGMDDAWLPAPAPEVSSDDSVTPEQRPAWNPPTGPARCRERMSTLSGNLILCILYVGVMIVQPLHGIKSVKGETLLS